MNSKCSYNKIDNNKEIPYDYSYEINGEYFPFPTNYMYGYTYVPSQILKEAFSPDVALKKGTLFPELVSEWCPNESIEAIEYLRSGQVGRGQDYV